jgi:hypothetical protein
MLLSSSFAVEFFAVEFILAIVLVTVDIKIGLAGVAHGEGEWVCIGTEIKEKIKTANIANTKRIKIQKIAHRCVVAPL